MIITLLILLVITIVIATGIIVQQVRYRRRIIRTSSNLIMGLGRDLRTALEIQDALEIGNQEIVENYENDFLDMQARLDASYNAAAYDREMREEAEKKLKLVNDLIDKHAGHCESILKEYVDAMTEEISPGAPSEG